MNILLFEDDRVPNLYPMSLARPAFAISCAGFRLIDLVQRIPGRCSAVVRRHLVDLLQQDYPQIDSVKDRQNDSLVLVVNGRCAPTIDTLRQLEMLADCSSPHRIVAGDSLAAAVVPGQWLTSNDITWYERFDSETFGDAAKVEGLHKPMELLRYPHDLIRISAECFNDNLEYRIRHGDYVEILDGVFAPPSLTVDSNAVFRTNNGPVVLESDVQVGPFSVLDGPVFVDRRSRIAPHSVIKDFVSIGHTCKIGGEMESTVVEPFTIKQHHGFLGHSYLGSWINLGAGTCNSDLKNTYGTVNMMYGSDRVATDMQFVGCFVGDYSKSAINTSIFTGKVIGCGSMLYGFVTTNVPSFCNYARTFGGLTQINDEVMITTQRRMFQRRNVEQRPCDVQLLRDMIRLTQNERGPLDDQPLEL